MKRFLQLGAISLLTACHSYETVNTSVYMDSSRPIKERVETLLRQMTLDEKIGQMDMVSEWDEQAIFDKGYYNFGAWICGQSLEQLNKMLTLSEKTRLKIPYLIGADAAHGNGLISGRTIFPTSISMAATFNRDLVKQTTTAASREIRTGGLSWIFAPSVDVVFDARWGRTRETYGESADRPSIDFYGRQTELVKALYETGKPVVAVIVNGKPLNNEWVSQNIPAIVYVWEPGMYGGKALAEILFGKVCPSGKLPITVPKHAGQVPMYYYHAPSRYWTGYGLGSGRADDQPAYPFGHGLSYTQFEYSGLEIDTLHQDSQVELSFTVKNTGKMAGKEVPLLFVRDCVSSVVTPKALLKEFKHP